MSREELFGDAIRLEMRALQLRALLVALLSGVPLVYLVNDAYRSFYAVSLAVAAAAVSWTVVLWWLIGHRPATYWRLQNATIVIDTSSVTALLFALLFSQNPLEAPNSGVVFLIYFVLLALASVHQRVVLVRLAAGVTIAQYGLVIAVGAWLGVHRLPPNLEVGGFSWSQQIARFIVLLCASLAAVLIVANGEELRRQRFRDPLTGLYNRDFFFESARLAFAEAQRFDLAFSVGVIDVDEFKRFNDTYGHQAGDAVLHSIGATLQTSFRRSDVVARWGGDEFFFFLFGVEEEGARQFAAALLAKIRQRAVGFSFPYPTISCGVASRRPSDETFEDLLRRADGRLYRIKDGNGGAVGGASGASSDRFTAVSGSAVNRATPG